MNPFITIDEALEVLKSKGADPRSGATSWQQHVTGVSVSKVHDMHSSYYKYSMHLDREGFEEIASLLNSGTNNYPIVKEHCFAEYDSYTIEVAPQIEVYKLELKDNINEED